MTEVLLTANGRRFSGWTRVTVQRSIEAGAGHFDLGITTEGPDHNTARGIVAGSECSVSIGDQVVVTGHVDDLKPSYSPNSHTVGLTGRDRTQDLVDCSVESKPGEWLQQPLENIVDAICKPFGIQVVKQTDTGKPFARFRINEGETAWSVIESACRMRAVLATPDGYGRLVLTRSSRDRYRVTLEKGVNIIAADGLFSMKERFSDYIVKSQQTSFYGAGPEAETGIVGYAKDRGIKRYRPKVIIAERMADIRTATDRAVWQARVNAARGKSATITVQGWLCGGELWRPNRLVRVKDDWLALDQDMLITAVTWRKSEQGTTCDLGIMPVGAFDLLPEPEMEATGWTN